MRNEIPISGGNGFMWHKFSYLLDQGLAGRLDDLYSKGEIVRSDPYYVVTPCILALRYSLYSCFYTHAFISFIPDDIALQSLWYLELHSAPKSQLPTLHHPQYLYLVL